MRCDYFVKEWKLGRVCRICRKVRDSQAGSRDGSVKWRNRCGFVGDSQRELTTVRWGWLVRLCVGREC